MKKTIIILFSIFIFINGYSDSTPRKLGYIQVDSIKLKNGETQTEAYKRDSVLQAIDTNSVVVTITQLNDSLDNYLDSTETVNAISDSLAGFSSGTPLKNAAATAIQFLNTTTDSLVSNVDALNHTVSNDSTYIKIQGSEKISVISNIGKIMYVSPTLDTTDVNTWKYTVDGDTLKWSVYNGSTWEVIQKLINN